MASLAVALAIVLAGVVGFALGEDQGNGTSTSTSTGTTVDGNDFGILEEIYRILKEDFVNPEAVTPDILRIGAINGVLQALGDPHTVYIDPESYSLGIDIISGAFEGIGAQVEQDPVTGDIVIVTPFRDSPAEKAGIRAGDRILAVDGESTEGWTVAQAVRVIRGAEGTNVVLGVGHSDGGSEDVTITRGTIEVPTVFTREIEDATGDQVTEIAYIELQQFTDPAVGELRVELQRVADEGYSAVILDLRRNPGGGLDATIEVADTFLDDGVILTQVDRDGQKTVFSAEGSVNHLRELSNDGALYVTIARWECPNGEQIEAVGIEPDVEVLPSEADIESDRDVQLFAAIDFLRDNLAQVAP
jgi:carboxyl-terminal processing protease